MGGTRLEPIGFRTPTRTFTYLPPVSDDLEVVEDLDGATTVVGLTDAAWDELRGGLRTFINLFLAGDLTFERGGFPGLADWDPVLTYLHRGTPIYDPARVALSGIDLGRTFTLDDSDDASASDTAE